MFLRRTFSTTSNLLLRKIAKRANPGLGHQAAELEDAAEIIRNDPEGFGDIESDLMNAHKSHKQYESEQRQQRDKIRQYMIKNKYFKDEAIPNLLTFAEKEQMRLMHSRDPEEWSVEKLVESFPTTETIVYKILKSNWKPSSSKRIKSHDLSVLRNWELYRDGKLAAKLTPEFNEHLKKFSERRIEDLKALPDSGQLYVKPERPKPTTQEFSSIITSCSKYRDDDANQFKEQQKLLASNSSSSLQFNKSSEEDETYLMSKVQDKRYMRLQELKGMKLTAEELSTLAENKKQNHTDLEQQAALELKNPFGTGIVKTKAATTTTTSASVMDYTEKFATSEIVISREDQRKFEMTQVKDRIHIPRRLYRKGATYRVEDCYYDDDGEFLYRVPGMTS